MPTLEKFVIRNGDSAPSWRDRLAAAVRSLWLGPYSTKDPVLARLFGGGPTAAGVSVNETSALGYAAVWQAVSLISGDVGSLPLHVVEDLGDSGKRRRRDHPLDALLRAPNPEMGGMVWREISQAHLLTWGNAYSEIERDSAGRAIALWPLGPDRVTPYRERGQLLYRVAGERDVILPAADVLHVRGLGYDGICGYSVITKARESLGLLAASEKFGAAFFGNSTVFGGTLTHPKTLGDAGQKNLRESVEAYHKGADKAHRFLILEEGMSYQQFGVPPNDAQFLETRQFQIAEVARWFNLPLHKLREMEHSSVRANIEAEALDYYTTTLRPWLTRWEQELDRKLLGAHERGRFGLEFNMDAVLRGDSESRAKFLASMVSHGIYTVNEARKLERLAPVPGGDVPRVPLNTGPITEPQQEAE